MAPETLGESVYTSKSDFWSYGILLWELVTLGSTPYPGATGREIFSLLKEGYRMSQPESCTNEETQAKAKQEIRRTDCKSRIAFIDTFKFSVIDIHFDLNDQNKCLLKWLI